MRTWKSLHLSLLVLFLSVTAAAGLGVGYWAQRSVFTAPPADEAYLFGQSVAVSNGVVVVGSPLTRNSEPGIVYVYETEQSSPAAGLTLVAKLAASDGQANNLFGGAVAIDGDVIVVGAADANQVRGRIYVYVKPVGGWQDMTETAQLTASDGAVNDVLGIAVSISNNTIVGGASGANGFAGAVYVFVEPNGGWTTATQTAKLTALGGASYDRFGSAVAIGRNTIVVGAPNASSERGGAYVFVVPDGGWQDMTQTAALSEVGYGFRAQVGTAVAVSSDGATVVAGAPSAILGKGRGVGLLYVQPPTGWKGLILTPTAILSASDPWQYSGLGASVAINDDVVLVGAPNAHCVGSNCYKRPHYGKGAVYGYAKPGTGWQSTTESGQFSAKYGEANARFGQAIAASGNTVVVGAYEVNAAYIFQYIPNSGFSTLNVPGSTSTVVRGINNSGQIVGESSLGAFLDTNGVFTTIAYPGAIGTAPYGINDVGEIVGSYSPDSNTVLGFTLENGVYTSLSFPGAVWTSPYGVNNLGQVVGVYVDVVPGFDHGFLESDGDFTRVDVPGSDATVLTGINDAGEMAGWYCVSPCQESSGFVYSDGKFTTVNYPGSAGTGIYGINDNGDFVGAWYGLDPETGGDFVYSSKAHQFIGFNIGGIRVSTAVGINNSGEIVGYLSVRNGPETGFYGYLTGR